MNERISFIFRRPWGAEGEVARARVVPCAHSSKRCICNNFKERALVMQVKTDEKAFFEAE